MKDAKKLATIFLATIAVLSCTNHEVEPESTGENTICYLKQIQNAGYRINYHYNSENRVEEILYWMIAGEEDSLINRITFAYNSEGAMVAGDYFVGENNNTLKLAFEYDSDGKAAQVNMSQLENGSFNLNSYVDLEYDSAGRLSTAFTYELVNGAFELTGYDEYEFNANGNVSRYTRWEIASPGDTPEMIQRDSRLYDNKSNPVFLNAFPLSLQPNSISPNNAKFIISESGNSMHYSHYVFEYNKHGYPISAALHPEDGISFREDYQYFCE